MMDGWMDATTYPEQEFAENNIQTCFLFNFLSFCLEAKKILFF